MNIDRFISSLNVGAYREPTDTVKKVGGHVQGFSAPYLMSVLSLAVQHLDPNELYLEIGTHLGRTLIGAMVDNPTKSAVAVDNFSEFARTDTEQQLHANMAKFGINDRVAFFNEDCQNFLRNHEEYHGRIGVYFYDGNHDSEQGLEGLINAIPLLSPNAVIILDDTSGEGIWKTVVDFVNAYWKQARLIFCMATINFPFPDINWHNGIMVIKWGNK